MLSINIKKNIIRNGISIISKSTNRKLIVIESDDWGSIRMPSKEVYEQLIKKGIPIENNPFNKYDTLASEQDLNRLFDTLLSIKDYRGNSPIITANAVVANPDFDKIRANDYKEYYYEPFTDTLKKYPNHHGSFELWKKGIDQKIFWPQFHGREHLNVNCWLKQLQNKNKFFLNAFEYCVFGINSSTKITRREDCMASFDFDSPWEDIGNKNIVDSGLKLFKELFGFNPKSFIAPTYVWSKSIERYLHNHKVKYLQGFNYQLIPNPCSNSYLRKFHYTGQKNIFKQMYLVRNAFFEPSLYQIDWLREINKRAEIAFRWNTPLIIGSHRVNFIGDIFPENRDKNLRLFKVVLESLLKRWNNIEFTTSDKLGDILSNSK